MEHIHDVLFCECGIIRRLIHELLTITEICALDPLKRVGQIEEPALCCQLGTRACR
jgi:hypothetical protein